MTLRKAAHAPLWSIEYDTVSPVRVCQYGVRYSFSSTSMGYGATPVWSIYKLRQVEDAHKIKGYSMLIW